MKVAIIQSNYLPWKGYFDIIHDVDLFVFEDDLQYTVRDWRNRNRIKVSNQLQWITVPVYGGRALAIDEVGICYDTNWVNKQLETIKRAYGKSKFFGEMWQLIEEPILSKHKYLSELNQVLIRRISAYLGVETTFVNARDLDVSGKKDDRLISICQKVGATSYLSGPAAKEYIIPDKFEHAGISLHWKDYSGYPVYQQTTHPFLHEVSIIDLIANTGKNAADYIWKWRNNR